MPHASSLIAFSIAASLLTITPGLDTMMVLRATLLHGRRPAAAAAGGIVLGCLLWGAAASLGLGMVLRASTLAYTTVKLAGAGYLIWLGATLLLAPRRTLDDPARDSSDDSHGFFRQGLLTNLLNPKVGVFYVTFLPQFVPAGVDVAGYSFMLAALHGALSVIWFAFLITAAASVGRWIRGARVLPWLDRSTGAVFVAFGVKLAVSKASAG